MAKYKITTFKNRFKTEGTLTEKTFEEIYFGFKNKVKRTKEKYTEYVNADKATKVVIKDVGGFIGGETEGNRRINGIRIKRQLLTLDIDTKLPNIYFYLERNVHFYCIVHSTHSHSQNENRYRIIAPLSREVNEDEYEALGRRIAYSIENAKYESMPGLFDETTFQANRLMFFPSVSADGEYICELLNVDILSDEQKVIDVDKVLDEYLDKNDIFEWFKPDKINDEQIGKNSVENKNPLKAKGMVGAFNRTYSITQAIEKFLSNVYKKERNNRYTFIGGDSHGGGLVLNGDTLFYSHHGTDPANLYYRSAFDLVRIHKFGDFDKGFTPEKMIEKEITEKTDSFAKMIEFCRTLPDVLEHSDTNIALVQRLEQQNDFIKGFFEEEQTNETTTQENQPEIPENQDNPVENTEANTEQQPKDDSPTPAKPADVENEEISTTPKKKDLSWISSLGGVTSNFSKLDIIFSNDDKIGNLFYYDTFRDNICFLRKPFWHRDFIDGAALQDKDMAHIRVHLEKVYGIKGEKMIDDAIIVEADKIQRNKVMDFFESLVWDGKERLEFFFNEFFKVPLNPFTRSAFKHWLVGAVSRIYKAGAPMDLLLVIKGKQGIGKSLFFKRLATINFNKPADHLYSDTKIDFDKAKDSYEQLEGIWIYEWKELAGMNMSEQESIKAFVDKTEDKFRRSYGRRNVEIKRRVAFGGTTNEKTPLRDRSGNRRFIVYESPLKQNECYINDNTKFTQEYRDQMIAEAIHLYKKGYDIFDWTEEERDWWERSNEDNLAENDLLGAIGSYVNMLRPKQWYSMSTDEMTSYINDYDFQNNRTNNALYENKYLFPVDRVCIQEIWKIALKQRDITINRYHRDLIIQALERLGWEIQKIQQRFGIFGHQSPFIKKASPSDELPF
jgi:putative DNA primase/helicase